MFFEERPGRPFLQEVSLDMPSNAFQVLQPLLLTGQMAQPFTFAGIQWTINEDLPKQWAIPEGMVK
jgi:hypothetical protein